MAKVIMIQGTMSNAGKSFITAGLCRLFKNMGYKTTPFKSQNMALNSYITKEGLEIGRAQAVQAEAAGVLPMVEMNPILLKPQGDRTSQVIVMGRVWKKVEAGEYFSLRKSLIPGILEAYHTLEQKFDIIVIEGAGSPAEINLKENDIVNMGLAKLVDAPVVLVGDIDRGGVFASLYGTLALLEKEERERVKGLIINKFRGDEKLLKPGFQMFSRHLKKIGRDIPILGTVKMADIDLEEEDSLAKRLENAQPAPQGEDLHISVIKLPHLSNFTDFAPLEAAPGISLCYVEDPALLRGSDLVILPGTKNTLRDALWMQKIGFTSRLLSLYPLLGICGGFQILGEEIADPFGIEEGGVVSGLGLLPIKTILERKKITRQARGEILHCPSYLVPGRYSLEGYEIHMGRSEKTRECLDFIKTSGGRDGVLSLNKRIAGTYFHGIFENQGFLRGLVKALGGGEEGGGYAAYKEMQYEKLSDLIKNTLNLEQLFRIMNL